MREAVMLFMLLSAVGLAFCEEPMQIKPRLAVSWGDRSNGVGERLDSYSKDAAFIGKLARLNIAINSNGVRIGGGRLCISGKVFNRSINSILSVQAADVIVSDKIFVDCVPFGKYDVEIDVDGRTLYREKIDLREATQDLTIDIGPQREISGVVTGLPSLAMESCIVGIAGSMVASDLDGAYKIKYYSSDHDSLFVRFKMPNHHLDACGTPILKYEYITTGNESGSISLPPLGQQVSLKATLQQGRTAPVKGMEAVFQNMLIGVRKRCENGSFFTAKCNPDQKGRVVFVGLPSGDYELFAVRYDGMPPLVLRNEPIRVSVSDGNVPETEAEVIPEEP